MRISAITPVQAQSINQNNSVKGKNTTFKGFNFINGAESKAAMGEVTKVTLADIVKHFQGLGINCELRKLEGAQLESIEGVAASKIQHAKDVLGFLKLDKYLTHVAD